MEADRGEAAATGGERVNWSTEKLDARVAALERLHAGLLKEVAEARRELTAYLRAPSSDLDDIDAAFARWVKLRDNLYSVDCTLNAFDQARGVGP